MEHFTYERRIWQHAATGLVAFRRHENTVKSSSKVQDAIMSSSTPCKVWPRLNRSKPFSTFMGELDFCIIVDVVAVFFDVLRNPALQAVDNKLELLHTGRAGHNQAVKKIKLQKIQIKIGTFWPINFQFGFGFGFSGIVFLIGSLRPILRNRFNV